MGRACRIMLVAGFVVGAANADGLLPSASQAGDVFGPVNELLVGADGGFLVNVEGTYNHRPSCSQSTRLFVAETQGAGSRKLYAAFLASLHFRSPVQVVGTGACHGAEEIVGYIHAFGPGPHP